MKGDKTMKNNKWKYLLSMSLTFCIAFSWNLMASAQEITETSIEDVSCEHKWRGEIQSMNCQHEERYVNLCEKCGKLDVDNIVILWPGEFGEHEYEVERDKSDYGKCTNRKDDGTPCGAAVTEGWEYCQSHGWTATRVLPAQEATCEEDGYGERLVCIHFEDSNETMRCDTIFSGKEPTVQKLGHQEPTELPWTVIKEATCSEDGKQQKLCRCNKVMAEEMITRTGNHLYEWATEPVTCHTPETEVYKCKVCGSFSTDPEYAPKEHGNPDESLHVFHDQEACINEGCQATLTTLGWRCSRHPDSGVKVLPGVAATCTAPGQKNGFVCPVDGCTTVFLAQQEIPVSKHVFGTEGICTGCGLVNASVTTKAENKVIDGQNKVVFTSNIVRNDLDAEIVEMGILYITKEDYSGNVKEDLTVTLDENGTFTPIPGGVVRAKQFNKSEYPDLENYIGATVTINLGKDEVNKDRTLYARGYVILKKNNTYEICYAKDVLSGTFNTGFVTN